MKKSIKCAVTGGAGFIGSNLCEELLKRNYEVYCLDNLITGNFENIVHLTQNRNFHFLKVDVSRPIPDKFIRQLSVLKYIYHLASPASPPVFRRLAVETLLVNSIGTYHLLEIAKSQQAKFLLASTSEVYGDPLEHPQKETYHGNVNCVGLRACYDESKRFAEALTMEYIRKFNVTACIIRIFNTYGPKMKIKDGRVISNFINQAITGSPLTVYGDGRQTRSFCYVSDMVRGLITAMEKKETDGKVINIGNPDEHTINDIALLILQLTGSSSKIIHQNVRLGDDPERRRPDITLAVNLLGWRPKIKLADGLRKTISYFQNL